MLKDQDKNKEPARRKAERKWRNHELAKKYKTGKMPFLAIVDHENVDYEKAKVHLEKNEPIIGSVVPPADPATIKLARNRTQKRLRELFSFLYEDMEHKKLLVMMALLNPPKPMSDEQMLYRLKLEKLRRLEAAQEAKK
jgi:hypothetical protein